MAAASQQPAVKFVAVALAGLASLVAPAKREGDGSDKLAERVLHLTACMLKNQDPAICAAAGPMVAGDAPAAY
uniref:Uncharacterized protein n=1 Tax=Tetradesmus obliquus TaxID=3088 RepID=A0A383VY78_TETOB|eukprot:jgi/Sobl393_1/16802/SZX69772.1